MWSERSRARPHRKFGVEKRTGRPQYDVQEAEADRHAQEQDKHAQDKHEQELSSSGRQWRPSSSAPSVTILARTPSLGWKDGPSRSLCLHFSLNLRKLCLLTTISLLTRARGEAAGTALAACAHWSFALRGREHAQRAHSPALPCSPVRPMASDDPSSFSFIVRLVHLSMYTLVELSLGITQLLRTSAAIDTMLVPEVASRLRDDPLTKSLVHQVGVFHVFVGLIAYMLRDEILDQRASARPFYMGMVCLQFALLRVTWQAEQAGLMNEHGTTTAACIAAIFGGGAAVALWTSPSVKDYDVEVDEHGVLTAQALPSERAKHE